MKTNITGINFLNPSNEVARQLIGATFVINGVGGIIVETEAYDQSEPASHTYMGKTLRNAAMFGAPGCAYVYRSYGIHWCLNFVCEREGHGAGVLIRAIEPLFGVDIMRERRGVMDAYQLCSGPGKLGQALGVVHAYNEMSLYQQPFELVVSRSSPNIVSGSRIGISKAVDLPWRFGLADSPFVSRKFL